MNLNIDIKEGRLTKKPEIKTTANGFEICEFNIAVNHYSKDKENVPVSFFNCKAFKHSAKFLTSYCDQGDLIFIEGETKQERWTDKEGKPQSRICIIANKVQLLKKKGAGASNVSSQGTPIENVPEDYPAPSEAVIDDSEW